MNWKSSHGEGAGIGWLMGGGGSKGEGEDMELGGGGDELV